METLDELVEQSDRLLMEIQGDTDLPMITRSLEQMGAFGEKLCSARGVRSDVKAARLLGSKINYGLQKNLSCKLESLSAMGDADFVNPKFEMDIHSFLKCERENILFTANEQAKKTAFEMVDTLCRRATSSWWDRHAAAILTTLASSSGPIDTDITHSLPSADPEWNRLGQFSQNVDLTSDHATFMSKEEVFYAKQIDQYLIEVLSSSKGYYARIAGTSSLANKPSLFDYLYPESKDISVFVDESKHSDLYEIFRMLRRLFAPSAVHVDDINSSETPLHNLPLPQTHSQALEARVSVGLQSAFLGRAIAHLEAEFTTYLQTVVSSNPRLAQLGGRPGIRALIRAFLNVRHQEKPGVEAFNEYEDGLVDGKPVWPMIYYCLRCGALKDAVTIATDAANNLGDFAQILTSYIRDEKQLNGKIIATIRKTYRRVVKTSRDPYKRIVYCLLGRCDLSDAHAEVAQSIDEFLWLRLSQVTLDNSSNKGVRSSDLGSSNFGRDDVEDLNLGQLQILLYETYGETHFDAWNQPLMYFKLLCLSQQFEGALTFLARFEGLRCHAVHIAMLLRNMKILLTPASVQTPLMTREEFDPIGFRRLNFARLLLLYSRKFETTNPCQALNYYYFLNDIESTFEANESGSGLQLTPASKVVTTAVSEAGDSVGNLFIQCVSELAMQTHEYDLLLGSINENGIRQPGAIDRFCAAISSTTGDSLSSSKGISLSTGRIIASVAETLESRGQVLDAVRIYLLACGGDNLFSAIRLTNLLLVSVVSGGSSGSRHTLCYGGGDGTTGTDDRQSILNLATIVGRSIQRLQQTGSASSGVSNESLKTASQTLFYLLDLATFFDLATVADGEQWQAALDHMDRLGIFPTNCEASHLEAKVANFATLPDLVRRPLPNALILLMRCLTAKAATTASSSGEATGWSGGLGGRLESSRSPATAEARIRARALITFVGRIPHRMPGEVYARLSQLEMQLS